MAISIGGAEIANISVGNTEVDKVSLGEHLVWESVTYVPVTEEITTVGTGIWVVPERVTEVLVHCIGGGGGSAGTRGSLGGSSVERGAAGGSYARRTVAVTPGENLAYRVGAGGTGGPAGENDGFDGESSYFGDIADQARACAATGGMRGTGDAAGAGTTNGCVGDLMYPGGTGGPVEGGTIAGGGGGGAGTTGPGGPGRAIAGAGGGTGTPEYGGTGGITPSLSGTGVNPGQPYGGGAGGSKAGAFFGTQAGAAGAQGIVVLEYLGVAPRQ